MIEPPSSLVPTHADKPRCETIPPGEAAAAERVFLFLVDLLSKLTHGMVSNQSTGDPMRPLYEFDLSALSPVQRMDLADALYDSAQQELEAAAAPLSSKQLKELDRRCAAVEAGELATEEWQVVHDRLMREL